MNDFDKTFAFLYFFCENKTKLWLKKYVNFLYMQFSKEDVALT